MEVSLSNLIPQSAEKVPLSIQRNMLMFWVSPSNDMNKTQDKNTARKSKEVAITQAAFSPKYLQPNPHNMDPTKGAKITTDSIIG